MKMVGRTYRLRNLAIFSTSLIFGFAILSLFAPIIVSNASDSVTQFLLEVKPVLALAAPPELDFGNITPTNAGTFTSKSVDALVATNATKGYELYFSSKDEATDMLNTNTAISDKITSSFTGTVTNTTMSKNNWGYSLNNTDFTAIPKKSGHKKLRNLTTKPTTDELKTTVHFGTKISTNLVAGNYEKSVLFTAVAHANPPKTLHSISKMQQMTPEICAATTTPNRTATALDTDGSHYGDPNYAPTKTLVDTRDDNTYTVSKLADGKCWMTQNLRIIDKTITPADSDVTANYTIPASSISGFNTYDISNAYVDSDDGFYTWYTATAGTGTQSMSSGNTAVSICPKGWRLPTGGDDGEFKIFYNNYHSFSALRSNPVNLTLFGYVDNSSRRNQGSLGIYWSSTVHSDRFAYYLVLNMNSSGVLPASDSYKYHGNSIRCIAR